MTLAGERGDGGGVARGARRRKRDQSADVMECLVRAAVAAVAAVVVVLFVATASAETTLSRDAFHVTVPDGMRVDSTSVDAPEGRIEVISLRPLDRNGAVFGRSSISFVVFPGDEPIEPSEALEALAGGLIAQLRPILSAPYERTTLSIAGSDVPGRRFSLNADAARLVGRAAALASPSGTIVVVDVRSASERPLHDTFREIIESFALGPAPEPATPADD